MEKRSSIKIAITGPESTGKSVMAKHLSVMFNGGFIPEYAREYVLNLNREYCYDDVEKIAQQQIKQYEDLANNNGIVFFDTWLIITKVWFDWVYEKVPDFVNEAISDCPIDLYLLLKPDLPWVQDPARENGGESRYELFNRYKNELEQLNLPYVEVGGIGNERFDNAERIIRKAFAEKTNFAS